MRKFFCKCGMRYSAQWMVTEHIGICNPNWPRTTGEDEHIQITEKEWDAIFTMHDESLIDELLPYPKRR